MKIVDDCPGLPYDSVVVCVTGTATARAIKQVKIMAVSQEKRCLWNTSSRLHH